MSQPPGSGRSNPFVTFLTAIQFLLISPAFIRRIFTPQELGGGVAYYPLVGALLGGLLIGGDWLLGLALPPGVRAALTLALWVGLTGALHLDGFLDSCDGLLGGFTPEQRLEIMRDERVGAYALAGGALLLLTEHSALSFLGELRWGALLLAPVLGRLGIALAIGLFPYGRTKGLGRDIKDNVGRLEIGLALVVALLIVAALTWYSASPAPLAALAVGGLVWLGAARFTLGRIPGLTGDSYGLLNTLVELSVLVVYCAW